MYEHLLVLQPEERIWKITLNRPRQLNALSKQTIDELHGALDEFVKSDSSVLLLAGSGRAFCFGADFTEFEDRTRLPALLENFQSLILKLYDCPKITVACLNGFATGAGLDLALACDFRIAAEKVKLGEAYVSMGLVSDGGGSYFLTHLLGTARAMEMMLLGEPIMAADAQALGIVHRICTAEELDSKALEFAEKLAAKPQTALRCLKLLIRDNSAGDLKTALRREAEAQRSCFEDPTHLSIVQEFLNRKKQ